MDFVTIGIIITAVVSIVLVVLQDRSSGVGGAFGGGDVGGVYQRRRGAEKFLFALTILAIATFAGLSIFNLMRVSTAPTQNVLDIGDVKVETVPASEEEPSTASPQPEQQDEAAQAEDSGN